MKNNKKLSERIAFSLDEISTCFILQTISKFYLNYFEPAFKDSPAQLSRKEIVYVVAISMIAFAVIAVIAGKKKDNK